MYKKYPRISIVTPSYNQGQYLEKTIKSVISQKYPNLEYFILDGGSTDNSVKIIEKYAKAYPKTIIWRSHKDKGQVEAINEGFKKASGDIVAYLNSDDYYLPGSFMSVARKYQSSGYWWIYGKCKVTDFNFDFIFFYKSLWPVHLFPWLLMLLNPINQPSVFLSKKIVNKAGKLNNKYKLAFDYDYWTRAIQLQKPQYENTYYATFRIHKNAKSSQDYHLQFMEEIEVIAKRKAGNVATILHKIHNQMIIIIYRLLK